MRLISLKYEDPMKILQIYSLTFWSRDLSLPGFNTNPHSYSALKNRVCLDSVCPSNFQQSIKYFLIFVIFSIFSSSLFPLTSKLRFEDMLPYEIKGITQTYPVAYLPIGSIEWHGPHLPFGTNGIRAYHIALRLCDQSGGAVWSTLWWGDNPNEVIEVYSPDSTEIVNTLQLPPDSYRYFRNQQHRLSLSNRDPFGTQPKSQAELDHNYFYRQLLYDAFNKIEVYQFKVIVVVVGHPPLFPHVQAAADSFMIKSGKKVLVLDDSHLSVEASDHAAKFETSLLMALRPDLVHTEKIQGKVIGTWPAGADPAQATLQYGQQILSEMLSRGKGLVNSIMQTAGITPKPGADHSLYSEYYDSLTSPAYGQLYENLGPDQAIPQRKIRPIAILPCGVVEWHERHSPIGEDGVKAVGLAHKLAQKLNAFVLPPVYYGVNRYFLAEVPGIFPRSRQIPSILFGNLDTTIFDSVRNQNLDKVLGLNYNLDMDKFYIQMIINIAGQLERHGVKLLVPVLGHYPLGLLWESARDTVAKHTTRIKIVPLMEADYNTTYGTPNDHAGFYETSITQGVTGLVDLNQIPQKNTANNLPVGVSTNSKFEDMWGAADEARNQDMVRQIVDGFAADAEAAYQGMLVNHSMFLNNDSQFVIDISDNDPERGCEIVGNNFKYNFNPGNFQDWLVYHDPGSGNEFIKITPPFKIAGNYEIFSFWRLGYGDIKFIVRHADGVETVKLQQGTATNNRWNFLGTYRFDPAQEGSLMVPDSVGLRFYADVFLFRLQGYHGNPVAILSQEKINLGEALLINYPNPFHQSTAIRLFSDEMDQFRVFIYDLQGKLVRDFSEVDVQNKELLWDGRDFRKRVIPAGVYILQLKSDRVNTKKKIMLIK